jgi:hypothetical protein
MIPISRDMHYWMRDLFLCDVEIQAVCRVVTNDTLERYMRSSENNL